jgi:DNA-binding NarL/FixJ family response regulator
MGVESECPISVLVVDGHEMKRRAVVKGLRGTGLLVCGDAANARDAIVMANNLRPDVVLLEIHVPGGGLLAAQAIVEAKNGCRIAVFTIFDSDDALAAAFSAGATGFILKGEPIDRVAESVRRVSAGEIVLSQSLVVRMLERTTSRSLHERLKNLPLKGGALSPREYDVLHLLEQGLNTSAIAAQLSVSKETIRSHLANTMHKLGVTDRAQLLTLVRRTSFSGLDERPISGGPSQSRSVGDRVR